MPSHISKRQNRIFQGLYPDYVVLAQNLEGLWKQGYINHTRPYSVQLRYSLQQHIKIWVPQQSTHLHHTPDTVIAKGFVHSTVQIYIICRLLHCQVFRYALFQLHQMSCFYSFEIVTPI